MKVSSEFSKYARHYGAYNIIQERVAQRLIGFIQGNPAYILDLGCGNGALSKKIKWNYKKLTAVDFAQGMLDLHPKGENIECIYGNFNDTKLFKTLAQKKFDYIVSASALQWAEDIEKTFAAIQKLNAPVALAIFTANTFKTLYQTASLEPLLASKEEIFELQQKYFDADYEVVEYKLEFDNVRDIFHYIKRSGVSGSRNVLSYKETKNLMKRYPQNYLEFEVAFISSRL